MLSIVPLNSSQHEQLDVGLPTGASVAVGAFVGDSVGDLVGALVGDSVEEESHQDGGKSELPGAQIVSLIQSYCEKRNGRIKF